MNSGNIESPQTSPNGHGDPYGYGASSAEKGHLPPSVKLRSESSANRKRIYDCRDSSSSEDESEGRRQEDDVTPKHKRRQPKVAEAYR